MANNDDMVFELSDPNIASELIGQDDEYRKTFGSLSTFFDTNEVNDYSFCLHKCDKNSMPIQKKLFLYQMNLRAGIKGQRAAQVVDVCTGLQRLYAEDPYKKDKKENK